MAGVGGRGGEKKDGAVRGGLTVRALVRDAQERGSILKVVGGHVRSYLQFRKAALSAKCKVG